MAHLNFSTNNKTHNNSYINSQRKNGLKTQMEDFRVFRAVRRNEQTHNRKEEKGAKCERMEMGQDETRM